MDGQHSTVAPGFKGMARLGDLLAKMGLKDDAKRSALFDATLQRLAQRKPASSTQVVPGSPTQLKQAAAAAPAAAPKK